MHSETDSSASRPPVRRRDSVVSFRSGIFAQVKLGSDEFRQTVAIKIFDKASIMARNAGSGGTGGSGASTSSSGASSTSGGASSRSPNAYQSHQLAQIEKELNALRTCSHPNIVDFHDVLETESKVSQSRCAAAVCIGKHGRAVSAAADVSAVCLAVFVGRFIW